jgi:hypothetical protein
MTDTPKITAEQRRRLDKFWMRQKQQQRGVAEEVANSAVLGVARADGTLRNSAIPTLAGDVIGVLTAMVVRAIRSTPVSATPPTNGQVLQYSSSAGEWVPVDASLTGSGGLWVPVTTGDVDSPEIVFDDGAVVMEFLG